MIRCNYCDWLFDSETDLAKILEVTDGTTIIERLTYDPCADYPSYEDCDNEIITFEIFNGCPNCMSDEHLINIKGEDLDKFIETLFLNLQDVPINLNESLCGNIEQRYLHFDKGTQISYIWGWLGKHHSKGLAYLLEELETGNENSR